MKEAARTTVRKLNIVHASVGVPPKLSGLLAHPSKHPVARKGATPFGRIEEGSLG